MSLSRVYLDFWDPSFQHPTFNCLLGVFGLIFGVIPALWLHLSRSPNQVLRAGGFLHSMKALKRQGNIASNLSGSVAKNLKKYVNSAFGRQLVFSAIFLPIAFLLENTVFLKLNIIAKTIHCLYRS